MKFRELPGRKLREEESIKKKNKEKEKQTQNSSLALHFYRKYPWLPEEFNLFSSTHWNNSPSQNTSTDAASDAMFWQRQETTFAIQQEKGQILLSLFLLRKPSETTALRALLRCENFPCLMDVFLSAWGDGPTSASEALSPTNAWNDISGCSIYSVLNIWFSA